MTSCDELKDGLLEQIYYENCPGCKVDRHKRTQTGLPIKQLVYIWVVVLCVALPISFLFPFLYFMIRDFNIAEKEEDISYYAGFVGVGLLISQTTLYPIAERIFGPIMIVRISGVLSIPLLTSYPYIAMLSGFMLSCTLNCASVVKNILAVSTTGTFMLQNKAVEQHQRGTANGIAMTLMSTCKAIGPACGGALLSWSQKRLNATFLPGDHMIFFLLNVIEGIGILLTFKPFLVTNHY